MSSRRHSASSPMAATAMPLADLERWLQARVDRHPAATSLPMLDGYVAAIVAGPVSMSPLNWICPLLAIDADAFNHGGTPEFAAISAVALRHNEISNVLTTAPDRFEPMHQRKANGDVDPGPWCQGFYTAMRLRLSAWAPLLDASNVNHRLLLPILLHCVLPHPSMFPDVDAIASLECSRSSHQNAPRYPARRSTGNVDR